MRDGERARFLNVEIEALDEHGTDITIEVNGFALTARQLESGTWRNTLPLEDMVAGEPVRVELRGTPHTLVDTEWTFGKVEMKLER